jgi:hypothetical protein
MKARIYTLALSFAACALLLTGCFDDFSEPFDGNPTVEFAQTANGRYQATVNDGSGNDTLTVNLIAPQFAEEKTIDFVVVDSLSTAEEGVNYTLPQGDSFTLPANSSFGEVVFTVLDGQIPAGETRTIYFRLLGSQDGEVEPARFKDPENPNILNETGPLADFEVIVR